MLRSTGHMEHENNRKTSMHVRSILAHRTEDAPAALQIKYRYALIETGIECDAMCMEQGLI